MPHIAFVPLTGLRVENKALRELGMRSPGLVDRGAAIARLPALGLLTLAGMTPPPWTCSYHEASVIGEELIESLIEKKPDLVAVSALTASAEEAYRLGDLLRQRGLLQGGFCCFRTSNPNNNSADRAIYRVVSRRH